VYIWNSVQWFLIPNVKHHFRLRDGVTVRVRVNNNNNRYVRVRTRHFTDSEWPFGPVNLRTYGLVTCNADTCDQQSTLCLCFSLNVVNRCVRCIRRHRFCHECVGEWCLRKNFPGLVPLFKNPLRIPMAMGADEVGDMAWRLLLPEIRGSLRQQASYLAQNTCPVCRVGGPFRRDAQTDTELLSMQVSNYTTVATYLLTVMGKS